MDEKIAVKIMKELSLINQHLNSATALTKLIEGNTERSDIRRSIGKLMVAIYKDLMLPIIKQYPKLDPDRRFRRGERSE